MNDFIIDEYGLFIGVTSVPEKELPQAFFNNLTKGLFTKYKKTRTSFATSASGNELDDVLYSPKGFKVIGEQDLIILSLIDDIAFPHRVFHPYHGYLENEKNTEFEYQVMTCSNSYKQEEKKQEEEKREEHPFPLKHIFTEKEENCTTHKKIDSYPYIVVSKVKVSNYFLLGNGIHFLHLIKEKLYRICDKENNDSVPKQIRTIVLDSFGSEELVIINFSDNLTTLCNFTDEIRKLQITDLDLNQEEIKKLELRGPHANLVEIRDLYKHVIENSLQKENDVSHVFSSFISTIGYKIDLQTGDYTFRHVAGESININFIWDVKPGHRETLCKEINKILSKEAKYKPCSTNFPGVNNSMVEYTMVYEPAPEISNDAYTTEIKSFFHIIDQLKELSNQKYHTRSVKLKLHTKKGEKCKSCEECEVTEAHQAGESTKSGLYKALKIKDTTIKNLRNKLIQAKIAKTYKERIMKMYNNYNNCVTDPIFFASFMELYGFMNEGLPEIIDQYLKEDTKMTSEDFYQLIDKLISNFEQAYYNRFHQSTRMKDMYEFNLEWNGGIQQVISSFDCIFKEIPSACKDPSFNRRFVNISGYSRVNVSTSTFHINMLYITYPELFAITLYKEFFNFSSRNFLQDFGFINNEFSFFLQRNIEKNKDFNRYNYTHQLLLNKIDENYITTLTADILSFSYGYNQHIEEFATNYWKILYQTSNYYDKNGKLSEEIFIVFLSRILLIGYLKNENEQFYQLFTPQDTALSDLWIKYFNDVLSFVTILKRLLDWKDFFSILNDCTMNIIESTVNNIDPNHIIESYRTIFDNKVAEYLELFQNNKIILKPKETEMTNSLFIVTVSFAFLKYINELSKEGSCHKSYILPRDVISGKPARIAPKNFSNILADPQGGFFCINPAIHKKSLQARIIYYKAIYNLTMLRKKEYLEQIKKNSQKPNQ